MIRHAAIAIALAGCAEPAVPLEPEVTSRVTRSEGWRGVNTKLDLLIVIDNSPGMAAHRANVLDNLRRLAATVQVMDLHVGVVTTDVGTRGAEDIAPGPALGSGDGACTSDGDDGVLSTNGAPVSGSFLLDLKQPDATRLRNYTGTLADALVTMADRGTSGCAITRPLEAVRRALEHPANHGFLRPDASLGVVLLTPGNDCSFAHASILGDTPRCPPAALVPVAEYAAFLKSLKAAAPSLLGVSAALGPATPGLTGASRSGRGSCADDLRSGGSARLHELLDLIHRSTRVSICHDDFSEALAMYGSAFVASTGDLCLEGPLADGDPAVPGTQHDCAVWYRHDGIDIDVIPACDASSLRPCYRIEDPPTSCYLPGYVGLELELGDSFPDHVQTIAECVLP